MTVEPFVEKVLDLIKAGEIDPEEAAYICYSNEACTYEHIYSQIIKVALDDKVFLETPESFDQKISYYKNHPAFFLWFPKQNLKCECGGTKCLTSHSYWCPAYGS